ncbi:putative Ubiquitin-like domain-containing protein [Helianthus annuus]|uniref:Putative ubiquilin, Ubiquitin-related domain protein n=1 Tax=Helianthus annuus TaxID=4232 RepID=A0A251RS48_HELAN|nr:putative Ubiquitin-like domain-containing protein [Helianthus annuus]KAJ0434733.1 putative Ubiquitin-like domain, ubiquilin, Ubiquitin-like domain superfamily [Helianthus annuus]KAJ0637120.1 putative Ubiquitin-like domain-containing protein [Helianthus annuus]KAJ0814225.1 putative ubiquilin, Ubiquitin-like domain superfamily [Helianthus annuus]
MRGCCQHNIGIIAFQSNQIQMTTDENIGQSSSQGKRKWKKKLFFRVSSVNTVQASLELSVESFPVQASLEPSVESFKSVVEQKCDIPAAQQRSIYKGRILKDDQTLKSYDSFLLVIKLFIYLLNEWLCLSLIVFTRSCIFIDERKA